MVKNRRRSTALKMALAGMCTALCIEGMLQRGLYVPAHAEDDADEVLLEEIISWINTDTKELDAFGVTAFGSMETALSNPVYVAVWAGYKTSKWFLENPSLEAVSDVNDTITVQNLQPHIAYFYPESGVKTPVFWYDLSLVNGLGNARINGLPFLDCAYYTASLELSNDSSTSDATPFISNIAPANTSAFRGYKITVSRAFNYNYNYHVNTSSYISGGGFQITNSSRNSMIFNLGSRNQIPTVTSNSFATVDSQWSFDFSGSGNSAIDMSSLPDIGIKQMFVPATASNWINTEFYPYVASQTEEGQPLEGFEVTPPPGVTPDLPDVGTLDSLNFPPGLPSVSFNDVELPSEPLPAKALQGAGFWFSSFSSMLDALGIKYIVITFLIIALIMAILKI